VPSPAAAFLLALIALPSLFWLVTFKRTTIRTDPEEWLMANVVPAINDWIQGTLPPLHSLLLGISAMGSGWWVALGFAAVGLFALSRGRRDLSLVMAFGVLCFPIEWALKFFTSIEPISLDTLVRAMFNVNGLGLDDIADFPAGHALRATALYGLTAYCIARTAGDRRAGVLAYLGAVALIGAISLVRIYLGAHYPIDVLGGWMAGASLVAVIVAVHVLAVDSPRPG
jgi:membrane-associated phospholipid phosphatase